MDPTPGILFLFVIGVLAVMWAESGGLTEEYHCDEYPRCIEKCPYGECNRKLNRREDEA